MKVAGASLVVHEFDRAQIIYLSFKPKPFFIWTESEQIGYVVTWLSFSQSLVKAIFFVSEFKTVSKLEMSEAIVNFYKIRR